MVALTQDAAGAADWQQMLAAAGMDTLAWPAFDVVAEPDAAVLQVFGRETMAAAQAAEAPLCVCCPVRRPYACWRLRCSVQAGPGLPGCGRRYRGQAVHACFAR